jgi:TrmH family RNA methyltransferase
LIQEESITTTGLILALDTIRDPGNLGTILRLCDWFGVKQILCSKETVDIYNPKVVQATGFYR